MADKKKGGRSSHDPHHDAGRGKKGEAAPEVRQTDKDQREGKASSRKSKS